MTIYGILIVTFKLCIIFSSVYYYMNLIVTAFNTSAFIFLHEELLQDTSAFTGFVVAACIIIIIPVKATLINSRGLVMFQKFSFFDFILNLCANSKESEVPLYNFVEKQAFIFDSGYGVVRLCNKNCSLLIHVLHA